MKLEKAEEILQKHYEHSLLTINHADSLTEEQKADQISFMKRKLDHMTHCVTIAGYLLRHNRYQQVTDHEDFLCGVLLHDIGNFHKMDKTRIGSGKNHASYGRQLLVEQEGFSISKPDECLILEMVEQHSAMKPWYTDDLRVNYAIRIVRDADTLENIQFLTQDILAEDRAIYFSRNMPDGSPKAKIREDFRNRCRIDLSDIATRSDALLAYASWKNNLTLYVAASLWEAKRYTEKLLEAAVYLAGGSALPAHLKGQKKNTFLEPRPA